GWRGGGGRGRARGGPWRDVWGGVWTGGGGGVGGGRAQPAGRGGGPADKDQCAREPARVGPAFDHIGGGQRPHVMALRRDRQKPQQSVARKRNALVANRQHWRPDLNEEARRSARQTNRIDRQTRQQCTAGD